MFGNNTFNNNQGPDLSTTQSNKYTKYLWIFYIVLVALEITKSAMLNNWDNIFYLLILGMILYCAIKQMSFWMMTVFMVYLIFPMIDNFFRIGKYLQDWNQYFEREYQPMRGINEKIFTFSVQTLWLNCSGVYIVFLTYREFKAINYEKEGIDTYNYGNNETANNREVNNGGVNNYGSVQTNNTAGQQNNNENTGFNAFVGSGVRIGGD